MDSSFFHMPDGPDLQAYLEAEERVVERMANLAESQREADPARAAQLLVMARRRARELVEIREWIDLR